jgi:hypothetical protein
MSRKRNPGLTSRLEVTAKLEGKERGATLIPDVAAEAEQEFVRS